MCGQLAASPLQAPIEAKCCDRPRAPWRRRSSGYAKVNIEGCGIGDPATSQKYAVIFEQAGHNWAAYVPDLPGCITTGKTLEETERNIKEAVRGHLAVLREFGEAAPPPVSIAREIEIPSQ